MQSGFLKNLRKRFGVKIFSIFFLFFLAVSFSFTAFFYYYESASLSDELIQSNLLLSRVLAYNSRIGVFSESEELLANPVDGIFQQEETVGVAIYNLDGRPLLVRTRSGESGAVAPEEAGKSLERMEAGIIERFKASEAPFYRKVRDAIEFWAPVFGSSGFRDAESLFIDNRVQPDKGQITGFVRIIVGKATLNKNLGSLLQKSAAIGLIFLLAGSGIIIILVRRTVIPLDSLRKGVQTLGKGEFGGQVTVDTEDEIGDLALAFNQMSESLQRREVEKNQLEEKLRHSQRMEAIGTLAGGIAHDFNNVIGIIMGYSQSALLSVPEGNALHRPLNEIYRASNRAKDLVRQILTFSRQGNQERNPLLIKPLVEEALKMMRASLPSTIEIRHNLKQGLATVLSDPSQIHQVLMNLCTNARDAMGNSGGVLEVTLTERDISAGDPELSDDMKPGRYQILTVKDTGHGMDSAIKERIFDPFFTTKGTGKGTGLGLSVVHGIVKDHGGKIECESLPGKGTTFAVYFPTLNKEVTEKPKQVAALPLGRERVLFVDDEAALADIGEKMLQGLGYTVAARTSSTEALAAFQTEPDKFDLLITDYTMPHMTGVELARKIRQIRPDLPVILCTGYSEGITEENIRALGIAGFLMKPIKREHMARAVRQVLQPVVE